MGLNPKPKKESRDRYPKAWAQKPFHINTPIVLVDFMMEFKSIPPICDTVGKLEHWFAEKVNCFLNFENLGTLVLTFDRKAPDTKAIQCYGNRYKGKPRAKFPATPTETYLESGCFLPSAPRNTKLSFPVVDYRHSDGDIQQCSNITVLTANTRLGLRELGPLFVNVLMNPNLIRLRPGQQILVGGLPLQLCDPMENLTFRSVDKGVRFFSGPLSEEESNSSAIHWDYTLKLVPFQADQMGRVGIRAEVDPIYTNNIGEGDLQIPFYQRFFAKHYDCTVIANDGDFLLIQLLFYAEHQTSTHSTHLMLVNTFNGTNQTVNINTLYKCIVEDPMYVSKGVQSPVLLYALEFIVWGTDFYTPTQWMRGVGIEKNLIPVMKKYTKSLSHLLQLPVVYSGGIDAPRLLLVDEDVFISLLQNMYVKKYYETVCKNWPKKKQLIGVKIPRKKFQMICLYYHKVMGKKLVTKQDMRMLCSHIRWNFMYWLNGWKHNESAQNLTDPYLKCPQDGKSFYGFENNAVTNVISRHYPYPIDEVFSCKLLKNKRTLRKKKRANKRSLQTYVKEVVLKKRKTNAK